jgi:hypothetical protein
MTLAHYVGFWQMRSPLFVAVARSRSGLSNSSDAAAPLFVAVARSRSGLSNSSDAAAVRSGI